MEDVRNVNLRIQQALKLINDFKSWHDSKQEKFKQSDMENLLKEVVNRLEDK